MTMETVGHTHCGHREIRRTSAMRWTIGLRLKTGMCWTAGMRLKTRLHLKSGAGDGRPPTPHKIP